MDNNSGNEPNRPQRSHFKSDFSMGQYEFERIGEIMKEIEKFGFIVAKYDDNSVLHLQEYLAALKSLYKNLKPLIESSKRPIFDKHIEDAQQAIYETYRMSKGGKIFIKGHKKLEQLDNDLRETKQFLGLGIMVSRKQQASGKMKSLLGLNKRDTRQ